MLNNRTPAKRIPVNFSLLALAAALSLSSGMAHAAEAPPAAPDNAEPSDTIVVTGFANTVKAAADRKRTAAVALDSILATDIAAFPDTNLAESIQRIPGVTITRDAGGEGKQVQLRGLSGDYTLVRLNGMPALSTSNTIDARGGTNGSRTFDFNLFASELFNRVDIRKSAEASQDEGGITGTVDLFTGRALDFNKSRFALSAQGLYNSFSEKARPRVAGLASWRNEDGTLGVLVSAAYSEREVAEKGFSTIRWQTNYTTPIFGPGVSAANVARIKETASSTDALFLPRDERYDLYDWKQKRLGLTGAFQYHPSNDLQFDLDVLYAHLNSTRDEYHLDNNVLQPSSNATYAKIGCVTASGDSISAITFINAWLRSDTARVQNHNSLFQIDLHAKARLSNTLTMDALLGYNLAKLATHQYEFFYTDGDKFSPTGPSLTFNFDPNANIPSIVSSVDYTNPASFRFYDLRRYEYDVLHGNLTGKVNFHLDMNPALTLHFGGFYNRQLVDFTVWNQDYAFNSSNVPNTSPTSEMMALPIDYASGLGAVGVPNTWAVANLGKIVGDTGAATSTYYPALLPSSTYRIVETVTGGYAQLDFHATAFGRPLRGNAGLRVASTTLTSQGFAGGTVWQALGNHYVDFMPSLNVVSEVTDKFQLRLNADRNISRPTLANLTIDSSINQPNASISIGNPKLKPFRSDSLSISGEYYLNGRTMISVTPFLKYIESTITSATVTEPYSATGLPLTLLNTASTTNTPSTLFTVSTSVNGGHALVKGVELIANVGFDFLPGFLKNTGILFNYTLADGNQTYVNTDAGGRTYRATLAGLTRHAANATLYYTDSKFDARLSVAYQGSYIESGNINGNDYVGDDAQTHVDASLRYNLTPRASLTFDAINLTNQAQSQYVGDFRDGSHRVYTYLKSGRSFMFGARFSM